MADDVIWSCPDCQADLDDDDGLYWCDACEHWWTPAELKIDNGIDERIL